MQRREVLRLLGSLTTGSVLSRLSPERLYALGGATHQRLAQCPPQRILDPHQHEIVATVAELIIPETDTPGARAAGVGEFIDLMVTEWYTEEERARFLAGLGDLDRRSQASSGRPFLETGRHEQERVLLELQGEMLASGVAGGGPTEPFFHQIKHLTLYGYYTSRVGVEQELHWTAIPGRYDSCIATGIGPARPR